MTKPRARFCWLCGFKLQGNHHTEKLIDGHIRILHKACAKNPDPDSVMTKEMIEDAVVGYTEVDVWMKD